MEIFLLLVDDLDDLFHAFRMSLLPKLIGLLTACGAFAAAMFGALSWPLATISIAMIAVLIFAIRSSARSVVIPRLKTDP